MVGGTTHATSERRYSTGNEFLDRRVNGGIRAGSLLALVAPPGTQIQVLLRELATVQRTTYLSTVCADPREIERDYLPPGADATGVHAPPDEFLADPDRFLADVDPESFVLVDSLTPVERAAGPGSLVDCLNALKRHAVETDGVVVLRCHREPTGGLPTATTLSRADTVWELTPTFGSRSMAYRLHVTKVRGGRALDEPIPLVLTDRVEIDTSWSI